ncbi:MULTISPECIES: L-tyrosine isonitrile synthase [Photorhabdus]|uniref:Paerucumarin biosynthesis protein PvcA n=1 Tax=Photorhabdus thracensis TaxID=230089 RepID=A0A0F7LSC8_9GAMM|nr:L-tyrosine isonitrile synthase [Photorhabdus thracensis]AKH64818.1 paerucumarin biosynthesis protein PvcA [Photorhabdus thracensis]MCC8420366.1 isocyanide synthase family protein [Photorhabdus thracensis]
MQSITYNNVTSGNVSSSNISMQILHELLQYRRRFTNSEKDLVQEEAFVKNVQLPRIAYFIRNKKPIEFILPAFPTKSPNKNKVLGTAPDMAERLSLTFLNSLCQRIQLYYPPGARIIICSDGHVFGDLIRVSDDIISQYHEDIKQLINEMGAINLSTFNLNDDKNLCEHSDDFDLQRQMLVKHYARTEESIKNQLLQSSDGLQLYRAVTRFLYEDSLLPGYTGSNNALQKDAKQRAIGVIQRSWAWGSLLDTHFPEAIRLSIHPQPADSIKLGIHMMPTRDDWLTPWHGVAANVNGQFILMKHKEVQMMGGKLVSIHGKPSHYVI